MTDSKQRTTFARTVFTVAGVYGLAVTLPLYFLETQTGPPPVTHPEYFYTFAGVTAAWQVLFLAIARNPVRYRPLMLLCILEKASIVVTVCILLPQERLPAPWMVFGAIDVLLAVLFAFSYAGVRTGSPEKLTTDKETNHETH